MKINIHEYPEGASALTLARYQAAVIEAFENGSTLEYSDAPFTSWITYELSWCAPSWSWCDYRYRIVTPKLAPGHNPDKLTENQVGIKDGWRLLTPEEVEARVDLKTAGTCVWFDTRSPGWSEDGEDTWTKNTISTCTFRTKNPPGFYLPKPEAFIPWTFDTAPKGPVLIRFRGGAAKCWGVVQAWSEGLDLLVAFATSGPIALKFDALLNRYEHSVDGGKTWSRCGVEESK